MKIHPIPGQIYDCHPTAHGPEFDPSWEVMALHKRSVEYTFRHPLRGLARIERTPLHVFEGWIRAGDIRLRITDPGPPVDLEGAV